MIKLRLLHKLVLGQLAAILVGVIITWVMIEQQLVHDLEERVRGDLVHHAYVVAELAGDCFDEDAPPPAFWQAHLRRIGLRVPQRITLVRSDGSVIADTDQDPASMDNHAGRPELVASLNSPIAMAESRRFSQSVEQEQRYVALAMRDQTGRHRGWVRLAVPMTFVERQRGQLRIAVSVGVAVAGLVAALFGGLVARSLARPLEQLSRAASALASGEKHWQHQLVGLPQEGHNEIAALVRSFRDMARELDARFQTIASDRNKLITMLAGMEEGVVAVDADGGIVHINDAARDLLGIVGTVTGEPFADVCDHEHVDQVLRATMEDDRMLEGEVRIRGRGRGRAAIYRSSPLRDAAQRNVGAVMVVTDQTERRRLDDMRRDFVANVSHELKTPLTVIHGILETIIDDAGMPKEMHRRFIEKAQAHTRRLGNLVSDLLSLSRLETQDRAIEQECFDLVASVRAAVGTLRETAQRNGITVRQSVPEHAIHIFGDGEAIRQVVDNLLSNAIRYSPPHTTVRVSVTATDRQAEVRVIDEGIGIPAGAQERIFERFYRVDKARSRELGGTGLGLSIVKHVVISHGGSIEVESEVGQGSVFTVRLPLAERS